MQGAQPDQPGSQEEVAVVEVHATEATEGAVDGEQDYPLEDDSEDDEDDEDEEDEEDKED